MTWFVIHHSIYTFVFIIHWGARPVKAIAPHAIEKKHRAIKLNIPTNVNGIEIIEITFVNVASNAKSKIIKAKTLKGTLTNE
jgi:hypothetical protein